MAKILKSYRMDEETLYKIEEIKIGLMKEFPSVNATTVIEYAISRLYNQMNE